MNKYRATTVVKGPGGIVKCRLLNVRDKSEFLEAESLQEATELFKASLVDGPHGLEYLEFHVEKV